LEHTGIGIPLMQIVIVIYAVNIMNGKIGKTNKLLWKKGITYTKDEIMKRIEQTGLLKYCIYSTEELKKRGIYQ